MMREVNHLSYTSILRLIRFWLPVVAIMALIFIGSTDWLSGGNTGKILVPIIRFFLPFADEATVQLLRFVIRKMAHLSEYAILATFIWRALAYGTIQSQTIVWTGRRAILTWVIATAYAASDEFHQSFHPSRVGSPVDVLIDSCGAASALIVIYLISRFHSHRSQNL